ncbi:MAG: type II toxin-antitoxin system VapC family toxin [bacterium]
MRIIIDTCTFLWFIDDNPKLSAAASAIIEDPNSEVLLSIANLWEMAIKCSIGKLIFTEPFNMFMQRQLNLNRIGILPINLDHVAGVVTLPFHHRDPFDRLMIAQAMVDNIPIVSPDEVFDNYPIRRLW